MELVRNMDGANHRPPTFQRTNPKSDHPGATKAYIDSSKQNIHEKAKTEFSFVAIFNCIIDLV